MKTLNVITDSVFKLSDTGSLISFKAFDDDYNVKFTKDDQLQFRIRNKTGYVMSVAGIVSGGGYWVNLDTSDLTKLVPDTYECELWDTKNGETDIYPDTGFVPFTVTANANVITGSTLPEITLDEYKAKFEKYCTDEVESAKSDIKADFQKFVDGIQDNAINVAKQASTDATNAINAVNNGLPLNMAKSLIQANTSQNLVMNSNMQTIESGVHPYTDWKRVWGWLYSNGNLPGRKNWYGYECIQGNQITKDVSLLSQGVYAGTQRGATTYSVRVHYRNYGTPTDTVFTFFLEYAYQADFTDSQKVELGHVGKDVSATDGWIIKENISVPEGYNWIRLRVEGNTESPEYYLFIGGPMINYGDKALAYVPSNQSGQRITSVEQTIKTIQQQLSTLTLGLAQLQNGGGN